MSIRLVGSSAEVIHDDSDGYRRPWVPPRWLMVGAASVVAVTVAVVVAHVTASPKASATPPSPAAAGPVTVPPVGGATTLTAGVPTGYQHNQAGAVAAATNYLQVFTRTDFLQPDARHAALRAIAAPGAGEQLIATIDPGVAQLASNFGYTGSLTTPAGRIVLRSLPIGFRVDKHTADRMLVSVWSETLWGVAGPGSPIPVQGTFSTDTVTLVWVAGDWRWSALTSADGPSPVGGSDTPSAPDQLAAADVTFAPYAYGGTR